MVAVKRITIVIIFLSYIYDICDGGIFFNSKRFFFFRMRFRTTNNDSEERNDVSEKERKLYASVS